MNDTIFKAMALNAVNHAIQEYAYNNSKLPDDVDTLEQLALQYAGRSPEEVKDLIPHVCVAVSLMFNIGW